VTCNSGREKHLSVTPSSASPTSSSNTANTASNVETGNKKIERQRQKVQERKQRRKEKKAAAAATETNRTRLVKEAAEAEKNRKSEKEVTARQKKQLVGSGVLHWKTRQQGVRFADLVVGKGPVVQDRKKVHVKYTLRAKPRTGKVLDSSNRFSFRLGKGEVVRGWDIGLVGMRQGGVRHLVVPPGAGYGSKNVGAGSGADLFFEVTMLSC